MEIHLPPELESQLNRVAADNGQQAEQVMQELVQKYIDHDKWFKQEIEKGRLQLDNGEFVSHDDVVDQIERLFRS